MKHIELNLGYACNNNCIFCMSGIAKEKIGGFEEIDKLKVEIKKLAELGYNSIGLLGGEPTIYPDFLEIIDYAKKENFMNIEVVTNGLKFEDSIFLEKAIKAGLTRISISVHSIDKAEEGVLTGTGEKTLEKKINAIKNCLKLYKSGLLKKEISVNIIISKINYANIKKTILFLYRLGIKSFRLNFLQLEGNSTKNYEKIAIRYEDFSGCLAVIISLTKKLEGLRINFEAIPWCYSGLNYEDYIKHSEQSIDSEKDKISTDDLDGKSREIVNQLERRKELKGYISKCENCFLKGECEGIWRRYINYFKLK